MFSVEVLTRVHACVHASKQYTKTIFISSNQKTDTAAAPCCRSAWNSWTRKLLQLRDKLSSPRSAPNLIVLISLELKFVTTRVSWKPSRRVWNWFSRNPGGVLSAMSGKFVERPVTVHTWRRVCSIHGNQIKSCPVCLSVCLPVRLSASWSLFKLSILFFSSTVFSKWSHPLDYFFCSSTTFLSILKLSFFVRDIHLSLQSSFVLIFFWVWSAVTRFYCFFQRKSHSEGFVRFSFVGRKDKSVFWDFIFLGLCFRREVFVYFSAVFPTFAFLTLSPVSFCAVHLISTHLSERRQRSLNLITINCEHCLHSSCLIMSSTVLWREINKNLTANNCPNHRELTTKVFCRVKSSQRGLLSAHFNFCEVSVYIVGMGWGEGFIVLEKVVLFMLFG